MGEEPPPHSGELNHALTRAGGPTQSQLSRPVSSGHHISMEHHPRKKHLNSDTNASNKTYLNLSLGVFRKLAVSTARVSRDTKTN